MEQKQTVHIYVRNRTGIFLQHRDNKKGICDPNKIGPFGGKIDETDASPHDAALRELKEETGLTPDTLAPLGVIDFVNGEHGLEKMHAYETITDNDAVECYEGQGTVHIEFGTDISRYNPALTSIALAEIKEYFSGKFVL